MFKIRFQLHALTAAQRWFGHSQWGHLTFFFFLKQKKKCILCSLFWTWLFHLFTYWCRTSSVHIFKFRRTTWTEPWKKTSARFVIRIIKGPIWTPWCMIDSHLILEVTLPTRFVWNEGLANMSWVSQTWVFHPILRFYVKGLVQIHQVQRPRWQPFSIACGAVVGCMEYEASRTESLLNFVGGVFYSFMMLTHGSHPCWGMLVRSRLAQNYKFQPMSLLFLPHPLPNTTPLPFYHADFEEVALLPAILSLPPAVGCCEDEKELLLRTLWTKSCHRNN